MEQFDAIVVGGSVSGSPTATWLARKGYKVLLIEKSKFPRDTNSTHFIWPRGMSYLSRLGVAEQILACTPSFTNLEVSIEGISLRGHVPIEDVRKRFRALHGDDHGVVGYYAGPRRYYLDKVLLDNARAAGVDVREEVGMTGVLTEDGNVIGVRATTSDGGVVEATAKVVIGADGRISQFAGHVNAKKTESREKSTFAYYGYFTGIDKPELAIHKRGRFGTAIYPTMENKHLVLVYGPTAWWSAFSENPEENFHRTYAYVAPDVAELVKRGERVEDFKAMGRMVAFHRESWGKGWAMVGDAGSFKDQWTAMGITHSLRDAELIAQHLDSFLSGKSSWTQAMATYTEVRKNDYETYWNFVCDGAQMDPYNREQLAYFHALSKDENAINQFMARVGDTVSFNEPIPLPDASQTPTPHFIEQFDAIRLGYDVNPYAQVPEDSMAA